MKKIMKAAVISAAAIALLASCASTKVSGGETTEPPATEKSTAVFKVVLHTKDHN